MNLTRKKVHKRIEIMCNSQNPWPRQQLVVGIRSKNGSSKGGCIPVKQDLLISITSVLVALNETLMTVKFKVASKELGNALHPFREEI